MRALYKMRNLRVKLASIYRYGNPSQRGALAIWKKLRIRKILPNPNSLP